MCTDRVPVFNYDRGNRTMKTITITLEFDDNSVTDSDIYEYLQELMYNKSLAYDEETTT